MGSKTLVPIVSSWAFLAAQLAQSLMSFHLGLFFNIAIPASVANSVRDTDRRKTASANLQAKAAPLYDTPDHLSAYCVASRRPNPKAPPVVCYLRNLVRFLELNLYGEFISRVPPESRASAVCPLLGGVTSGRLRPCLWLFLRRSPTSGFRFDLRSSLYACHPRPVNGYPGPGGATASPEPVPIRTEGTSFLPSAIITATSGGLTHANLQPQPPAATGKTAFTSIGFSQGVNLPFFPLAAGTGRTMRPWA